MSTKKLEEYVYDIPDFPKPGIIFRDITGILSDAEGLELAVDEMMEKSKLFDYDVIVGAEARGFIFGMPMAYLAHKPFMLVRKKGKLPRETISESYELEYGTAEIEICTDSIQKGQKILIVDDLLATGGTLKAITKLVERLGGEVAGVIVVMELLGLEGRKALSGYPVESCISYPGK